MKERVNIFITRDEKIMLTNIKYKYRLSISTIVEIIIEHFSLLYPLEQKLNGERLIKGGMKTSIKVNKKDDKPYTYYENAIHLFLNKQMMKDIYKEVFKDKAERQYSKLQNTIYNKFAQTTDDYYEYNQFIRYKYAYERREHTR